MKLTFDQSRIETPRFIEDTCSNIPQEMAFKMEEKFNVVVKPRPWYCPMWLYKKIIKDSVTWVHYL